MSKSKAERKKQYIRIGAIAIAGIMTISVILTIVLNGN